MGSRFSQGAKILMLSFTYYRNCSHGLKAYEVVTIPSSINFKRGVSPSIFTLCVDATQSVLSFKEAASVIVDFLWWIVPSQFGTIAWFQFPLTWKMKGIICVLTDAYLHPQAYWNILNMKFNDLQLDNLIKLKTYCSFHIQVIGISIRIIRTDDFARQRSDWITKDH